MKETVGATFDCPSCQALLLHSGGDGVVEMHGYPYSGDPRWTPTGGGAASVVQPGRPEETE